MLEQLNVLSSLYHEGISQLDLQQLISSCVDLNVYTFTNPTHKGPASYMGEPAGFEPLTIYGGQWFELVSNPAQLYENLMQIIDDNACE